MKPISERDVSWRKLVDRVRRRVAQRRWRSARRLAASGPLWAGLGLLFVAVTVLGTVGFSRYEAGTESGLDPFTTRVYQSLQLFVMESGAVPNAVPWQLEVARFAAPVIAAFAIVQTLAAVFRAQVESLRLRMVRGHVVVAGLGRKGRILVQALLSRGDRVVVIEADDSNAELDSVRAVGGLVVVGDAKSAETQRRARVERASHVIALCGNDAANADIVASAREQSGGKWRRTDNLQCIAQMANPELCLLLSTEELERYGQAPVRMDFVDVYEAGAQALVRTHPPWRDDPVQSPSVLLVGDGPTARHLLLVLVRTWATRKGPDATGPPMQVTIVGDVASFLSPLRRDHPELDRFADIQVFEDLGASLTHTAPTVTYVCPDDDTRATTTALNLRGLMVGHPIRIVVVLEQRAGLGHLLQGAPQPPGSPTLETYAPLEEACQPDVLLSGTTELLAEAMHEAYRDSHVSASRGDSALKPWDQLPDVLRESNRDQAAHVAVKLAAIGRIVGPLVDWDAAHEAFCDADVEVMARLEHDRWITERRRAGWRLGARDTERRTSPYLVPWEQLPDEIRDSDRMFVLKLPELLASVGLQAHQLDKTLSSPDAHDAGTASKPHDHPQRDNGSLTAKGPSAPETPTHTHN